MTAVMAVVAGVLFAAAVAVAVSAWTAGPVTSRRPRRVMSGPVAPSVAAGVVGGLVGLVVSGWVVLGFGCGIGAGWGWWTWTRRAGTGDRERLEALATWCEQLRDLIRAHQGAVATITATRDTAPLAIRDAVTRLSVALRREDPQVALARFAADVNDADADMIASVLALSMTHSGRTSELLHELAVTIRERAAIRTRIDTARAGDRTEARFVTAVAIAGILLPAVFARHSPFFAAYGTTRGQTVLFGVLVSLAGGLVWLARLARFDHPSRFYTNQDTPR